MGYKLCKFYENCARDMPLWGVYTPHFDQISVKISVLGSYTVTVAPMGVKFGMEKGTHAKFHPNRCNVSPLRGKKPQNQPLRYRPFVLCALLPVISKLLLLLSYDRTNVDCLWPPLCSNGPAGGHYVLPLWFLSFFFVFSSLVLSGADWMSTILPHIM